MNTMLNNGLKMVTCGAAALVITLAASYSFVQSTAVVRGNNYTPAPWMAMLSTHHPVHFWLGQPQPAVLVD